MSVSLGEFDPVPGPGRKSEKAICKRELQCVWGGTGVENLNIMTSWEEIRIGVWEEDKAGGPGAIRRKLSKPSGTSQ